MDTLHVTCHGSDYPIYFDQFNNTQLLFDHIQSEQVFIVTSQAVAGRYLQPLQKLLAPNYQCDYFVMDDGEQSKTLATWQQILNCLVENKHRRNTTIIALGGGVVGDVAGFAAACYQRGTHYIQIPTTLMAQVDASIGGKTALNFAGGKNVIGAFYPPNAVIIDSSLLKTLPDREYRAGLVEVIKHALVNDAEFFSWLEKNIALLMAREQSILGQTIFSSCQIKAQIVSADERDHGIRRILNYGHSFAHGIEAVTEYKQLLHGEAVALGILIAGECSCSFGILSVEQKDRIAALISKLYPHFPPLTDLDVPRVVAAMLRDKKNQQATPTLVLLKAIGEAKVTDQYPIEQLSQQLTEFFAKVSCQLT